MCKYVYLYIYILLFIYSFPLRATDPQLINIASFHKHNNMTAVETEILIRVLSKALGHNTKFLGDIKPMIITDASINEHKHEPLNYQPVENFNFLLLSSLVQSRWWTEFYVNVSVCGFIRTHTDASVITGIHKYCYQRSSSTDSLSIVRLHTYAFKYCFPAGSYCFILCIMSSWLCYSFLCYILGTFSLRFTAVSADIKHCHHCFII